MGGRFFLYGDGPVKIKGPGAGTSYILQFLTGGRNKYNYHNYNHEEEKTALWWHLGVIPPFWENRLQSASGSF